MGRPGGTAVYVVRRLAVGSKDAVQVCSVASPTRSCEDSPQAGQQVGHTVVPTEQLWRGPASIPSNPVMLPAPTLAIITAPSLSSSPSPTSSPTPSPTPSPTSTPLPTPTPSRPPAPPLRSTNRPGLFLTVACTFSSPTTNGAVAAGIVYCTSSSSRRKRGRLAAPLLRSRLRRLGRGLMEVAKRGSVGEGSMNTIDCLCAPVPGGARSPARTGSPSTSCPPSIWVRA
jgi:hypothetical protein